MLNQMVQFTIARPKTLIGATVITTILFGSQLPKITTDTDPKHMLPITSHVRQYNDQVEREFELHPDVLVLGVVNGRGYALFQSEIINSTYAQILTLCRCYFCLD